MSDSINKKIVAIMGEVDAIGQSGYNTNQKYKYTQAIDVIREVRQSLVKYGLRLKSKVLDRKREDKLTVLTIEYSLIDRESGEVDSTTLIAEGMDGGDKAANKAMTAGLKYFFRDTFLLEFADDPEKEEEQPTQQKKQYQQQTQSKQYEQQTAQQNKPQGLASEKQLKKIFAVAKQLNQSPEEMKEIMLARTGKTSSKELTSKEASELIKFLEGGAA